MRKQRTTYNPEEKARIVLEVLREDSTLNEISTKYSVSPQLISRWKTEFLENKKLSLQTKVWVDDLYAKPNLWERYISVSVTIYS